MFNFVFCRYNKNSLFYPRTTDGDLDNVGTGYSRGFNVNCCLPYFGAGDADYFVIWEQLVLPLIEKYGPDMILISAGFDVGRFRTAFAAFMFLCKKYMYFISLLTAHGDTIGDCKVTPMDMQFFITNTKLIVQ
jgi:acetoin utilization deacetylase AcuC-like enzyme